MFSVVFDLFSFLVHIWLVARPSPVCVRTNSVVFFPYQLKTMLRVYGGGGGGGGGIQVALEALVCLVGRFFFLLSSIITQTIHILC